MSTHLRTTMDTCWHSRSRVVKVIIVIVVLSAAVKFFELLTRPDTAGRGAANTVSAAPLSFEPETFEVPELSQTVKEEIIAEFPAYTSRNIEQTYLTLPEWYQVYNYNEFGDFLQSGGRQTDFPFLTSIRNFWEYYGIALQESKDEKFNWLYNFVDWVIGINFTLEYLIKSVYENTVGSITQFIAGSETEADAFIADSWNNYAEKMYQATWYHYPYFDDLKGIWTETSLFDKSFVRSLERKVAFSISYAIKGTYAKLWLLTAAQKENQTFSIVYTNDRQVLEDGGAKILKEMPDDMYLIETERYAGFKDILLRLVARDVRFVEIMGHKVIALAYLSRNASEPFVDSESVETIDKRRLFFNTDNYAYRVMIKVAVRDLGEAVAAIKESGSSFEMIYDF